MDRPLQVTFHNLEHSDAVEQDIRGRIRKLDEICNRITACRVVVDSPNRTAQRPKTFAVRIEVGLPGTEIIVAKEPGNDVRTVVTEAFDTAKRRLLDHMSKQRT